MEQSFDIPILLVTFNRPDTTRRVFERIRAIKPARLYLFSDSPRAGNSSDEEKVKQTRALITQVDWNCEVFTKFETSNMGCGPGPSSAISWIFDNEKKAIVLEDDCLPHPSFFTYCKTMLDRYENDPEVMHIAGTRWNEEYDAGNDDYFFSSIGHIWGWASWQRAWKYYDYKMRTWNPKMDRSFIGDKMKKRIQTSFWMDSFQHTYIHNPTLNHAWDYQWQYTLFRNNGLSIVPNVNLISNIGVQGVHAGVNINDTEAFNREVFEWKDTGRIPDTRLNTRFDLYHVRRFFLKNATPNRKIKLYLKSFLN